MTASSRSASRYPPACSAHRRIHRQTTSSIIMNRIAKSAQWLFDPPTPPDRDKKQEEARQRRDERDASTPLFKDPTNSSAPSAPQKKKRQSKRAWSAPRSAAVVHQMVLDDRSRGGQCCSIRCTEKFSSKDDADGGNKDRTASSSYSEEYLRVEQDKFALLTTERDRKQFTLEHVPPAKLSNGSMLAAGSPVCNFAYIKFFGVTSTLISSCKGTPRARASPAAKR